MMISIPQAQLFFLAFTRIMAVLLHIPVFGGQNIPPQVRLGLGFVLAFTLLPWQPLPPTAPSLGLLAYAFAIAKELILGTILGFAADLAFGAMQTAGAAMGMGSGFESGRIFNPALAEGGSAFDQLFVMTASVIFLLVEGHHLVLLALQRSFIAAPLNGDLPLHALADLARLTTSFLVAGIQIALPVVTSLLLADLTLGLLARVAPQVQVYFLGLPAKVAIALLALGFTLTVTAPQVGSLFRAVPEAMLRLLGD